MLIEGVDELVGQRRTGENQSVTQSPANTRQLCLELWTPMSLHALFLCSKARPYPEVQLTMKIGSYCGSESRSQTKDSVSTWRR